jgi:hypothetical protein
MDFFERPILNSPYAYPGQHWELENGLPTNRIVSNRRRAELLSPIPKAKKQKAGAVRRPDSSTATGRVRLRVLSTHGRWAFAELTDVLEFQKAFSTAIDAAAGAKA